MMGCDGIRRGGGEYGRVGCSMVGWVVYGGVGWSMVGWGGVW